MKRRKHKEVLLYMITTWVGPKIVAVVSPALWETRIKQWAKVKSGLKIEFLIVET